MILSNNKRNSLNLLLSVLLIILIQPGIVHSLPKIQKLNLVLGQHLNLPLVSSNIWIQNQDVLEAKVEGMYLDVRPKAVGETFLKIGETLYRIQVSHPYNSEITRELQLATKKTLGLEIETNEGRVVVSGSLFRLKDWKTLAAHAANMLVSYRFSAKVSTELQRECQKHISSVLRKSGLLPGPLIFGEHVELRIAKGSGHLNKYQQTLQPYGIEVSEDKSAVRSAPVVKIDIIVTEVRKDLNREWGLNLGNETKAELISNKLAISKNLVGTLKALESEGEARILANPNIVVRSGAEAEFLAGGEIPLKSSSQYSSSIQWKKHGVILKVKPLADTSGRMSIKIMTEVSMIDPSVKIDNIPGFLTNRVSSHFDLDQSRTIALSGMLKKWQQSGSTGLPFLASIPIIGALFGSQDFRNNKTEMIIFIKPQILNDQSPELNANVTDFTND